MDRLAIPRIFERKGRDSMNPLAPVTSLLDRTEEALGHSPHPAVVALPLGAWAVSNISDGMALVTGDDRYDDVARVSMGIGLVGASVAAVTGIRDYSFIPEDRPSHEVATMHALGNTVVGTLFAASYILRVRDGQAGRPTSLLARTLAFAGGGLALYTAWLGGKLVEEYGEGVKPVMDKLSDDESEDDEHADRGRGRLDTGAPLGVHHG
jgi:uncharacterized membrane protein